MPNYNVTCPNPSCDNHEVVIEINKKMSEDMPRCACCATTVVQRFITAPNYAMKGSGWYGKKR
jgi:predicted nucleic acid-binding Zn ribbon protein